MFQPKANDDAVTYKSANDPRVVLSDIIIVAKAAALSAERGLLIYLLNGKSNVNLIAANFIKAAIEPVNVIPPIKVPKNEAILCNDSTLPWLA